MPTDRWEFLQASKAAGTFCICFPFRHHPLSMEQLRVTLQGSTRTARFAGLQLAVTTPRDAVRQIVSLVAANSGADIHFVNAYTVALADRDEAFKEVLLASRLNLPDGRPLALLGRLRHGREFDQVRGPSFFRETLNTDSDPPLRHFFLGGTGELLERLVSQVKSLAPTAIVAGSYSPPFRAMTDQETAYQDQMVQSSSANIVWVGLGTPKQDFEAARLARELGLVCIAVGAAFDFTGGTKAEAPQLLSRLSLEWLFRLMSEPRRLWRRYLFGNARFVWAVARDWGRS